MKYRAEIDGLRALAVIPVILFHAGFELFSGGFVGVDVFFVISGYLITTILIGELEDNRFSIVNFYERRARRILPALFFIMIICIPFAWLWMPSSQFKDFSQSLVAVSFFASNILFWRESGYFASAAEEKPLLHTWSLAVEEQYYILFPIFLFFAWRYGKNKVFWMIVAFSGVSLALSEWGWRNAPTANFYLAPTRAWELFAGSIAAFVVNKHGVQKNNVLALLGLVAIIYSIFAYDESTPFPSVYALVPVVGVVLLVLFADKDTIAARFLSTKAFVGVGLISYSAYLWHQPLFAFSRVILVEHPSELVMVVLSIVSMLLAFLSWKYVEKPFRNKSSVKKSHILAFSLTGFSVFIMSGLFFSFNVKLFNPGSFHPLNGITQHEIAAYTPNNKMLQKQSWDLLRRLSGDKNYGVENNAYDNQLWFQEVRNSKNILVIGNSHSKDIFNILSQAEFPAFNVQLARYGLQIRDLNKTHKFWGSPNYNFSTHVLVATRYQDSDIENLPKVVERIKKDGKKAVIVYNIFEFPGKASGYSLIDRIVYSNKKLSAEEVASKVNSEYYRYYKSSVSNHSFYVNQKIYRIANEYRVDVLNRMDYVCSDELKKCFAVQSDLTKNFYDYGHHTLRGSGYFSQARFMESWVSEFNFSLSND